jgi:DUF4097 and DUF4098 domain-containing protein YvlB
MSHHSPAFRTAWGLNRFAAVALLGLGIPALAGAEVKETERVDKVVKMAAGGTLTLKNFSGKVEITGSDRQDVSVQAVRRATRERLDRIKLDIQSDGTNVTIEANKRDEKWEEKDNNVVETDFVILMPGRANLDVKVFSSPVTITGVTGTHKVHGFSSDLTLDKIGGPVDAETFSGTIHLASTGWSKGQTMRLKTFSGDIELRAPESTSASLEFDSFSGDLRSDLPLMLETKSKRNLRARLNVKEGTTPDSDVRLKTFSGDVRIMK